MIREGMRVRRKGDSSSIVTGIVSKDPDGTFRVTFDSGLVVGASRIQMNEVELKNEYEPIGCDHRWTLYTGLIESYDFCLTCGVKK